MIRRHSACEQVVTDLDALLDAQLPGGRAGEVRAHLRGCGGCRGVLVQLSGLRSVLADTTSARTPDALSARLAGIAGESCGRPLWMAGRGRGPLGSPRMRRRRQAATGSVAVLVVTVVVLGLGLVLAPSLPTVADAQAVANLEYDLSTGSGPVAGAVSAVQATSPGLLQTATEVSSPRMVSVDWRDLEAPAARALLQHASRPTVGFRGIQKVMLAGDRDFVVAEVEVLQQPGEPLTVTVLDPRGRPVNSGLLSLQRERSEAVLPAAAATFQQASGGQIADQPTTLLEAHRADGSLLARWWIAESLGLVMWSESFDGDQHLVRSAGFTTFSGTTSSGTTFSGTSEGAPSTRHLQVSLALERVAQPHGPVCRDGFTCATELAGLPLLELRADSARQPTVVCALYGSGDTRVSVLMRRGQLGTGGARYGLTPDRVVVAWQSSTVVYAVTTNAGPGVASAVSQELPHDEPVGDSTWERVRLGLARLLG